MFPQDDVSSSFYPLEKLLAMQRDGNQEALEKLLIEYGLNKPSTLIRSEQKPEIEIHYEQVQDIKDGNLWRVEFGGKSLGGSTFDETLALDASSMLSAKRKSDSKELESLQSYIPDHLGIAPFPRMASLSYPPEIIYIRRAGTDKLNLRSGGGFNIDRLSYPWCTVGKIVTWGRYEIPGFFPPIQIPRSGTACVVGRNVVLTASHVIPWGATSWSARFIPAASSIEPRQPYGVFNATNAYGYSNIDGEIGGSGYDMTILRMDRPVGDITGWMGSISDNKDEGLYYKRSWTSMGYPGSYQLTEDAIYELSIKVQDVDNDDDGSRQIETEPFTDRGWSGGPLFSWFDKYKNLELNGPCVAGTLSGRGNDFAAPEYSVFSGGDALVRLIKYGRDNW
jgi:V8-like Glu-specific endopeptidase